MTLTLTKNEKRWGWLFLLLYLIGVPFAAGLVCGLMGVTSETVLNIVCFYANAALAILFFRKLLQHSLFIAEQDWKGTIRTAVSGFGLYWLVNAVVNTFVLFIQPDFANVNDQNLSGMIAESPVLMNLALIVAAPLAEECLFRGWLFTGLAEKNVPLAYAVTCGLFSAAHVAGYIGSYEPLTLVLCFLQYIGPSFALCWTCRKNDSLIAPLLLHMSINTIACVLIPLTGG